METAKSQSTTPKSENLSNDGSPKRGSKHVAFRDDFDVDIDRQQSDFSQGKHDNEESNPQDPTLKKTNNGITSPEIANAPEATGAARAASSPSRKATSPPTKASRRKNHHSKHQGSSSTLHKWKQRKRGRLVRVVTLENEDTIAPSANNYKFPPLPSNQYATALRRRAVRKLEDKPENKEEDDQKIILNQNTTVKDEQEEYGDISLGMKLIVAGGRVIVQTLNPLSDGRASPAQLAGVIQRGDVLLAIGSLSLVNLPVDQLMQGLKPLSAPGADGNYRRILNLRFEIAAGLELLKAHEESQYLPANEEVASDMFSLFPMVDQLSGTPLFEDINVHNRLSPPPLPASPRASEEEEEEEQKTPDDLTPSTNSGPDAVVSTVISKERTNERERYASKFFNWQQELQPLLKETDLRQGEGDDPTTVGMTKSDRIEVGTVVMNLAKSLAIRMEDVDKGKDMRSFKTWSSNFSLRSGASARRRYILDNASLRSHRTQELEASFEESVGSADSGSLEGVDGDALLLGLAAHDGIWRKQVVDALKEAIEEMKGEILDEEKEEEDETAEPRTSDIDTALTKELGSFLFGENISRIITKNKKSHALPPEEITTVLFDLTTHIATSAPDEITVFGGVSQNPSLSSGFGTFGKQKSSQRADMLLANRFILDEALPVWLLAFQPFPLDQRRVLWPRTHVSNDGGGANTYVSDGDSLTVESLGSASKSPGRAKNLREIIEDQALDIETRAETCFLVTYYFTQEILSPYSDAPEDSKADLDEKVVSFVQQYGAYLQIHSCLSFSAAVRCEMAIEELLKVSAHDPSHRDAVREIQKGKSLTFYDTNKLSAVLTFMVAIRFEHKPEKRNFIRNLCVSAYPDVQPWQMRKACLDVPEISAQGERKESASPECMRALYYKYLSMLLDPMEGHDAARHDSELVGEWCALSLGFDSNGEKIEGGMEPEHKNNFLSVASRVSSDHLAYKRDLVMLLDFSMKIGERDLALDLLGEILDSRKLTSDRHIPSHVLVCLRDLGDESVRLAYDAETEKTGFNALKRVLLLFHRMAHNSVQTCRESIVVAEEIHSLLGKWEGLSQNTAGNLQILTLVDFLVAETSPRDVLLSLVLWSSTRNIGDLLYSRIDALLRRGVNQVLRQEMSGSLLRLKHARESFTDENKLALKTEPKVENREDTIWRKVSVGSLPIDK